jgi:hypothetical protein
MLMPANISSGASVGVSNDRPLRAPGAADTADVTTTTATIGVQQANGMALACVGTVTPIAEGGRAMSWRDDFKVHPAADVFPMMPEEQLAELTEDVKANRLTSPISFFVPERTIGHDI